jgi:branched-chain amino acid transport system permease protein
MPALTLSKLTSRPPARRSSPTAVRYAGFALLALVYVATPMIFDDASINTLTYCAAFAIGAIGLTLLTGYAGQVSLAQPFFMGVGAYTAAYLGAEQGLPAVVFLPAAIVLGAALGAASGSVAVRLGGSELAVITLGLLVVGEYAFNEWIAVTGGENGRSAAEAQLAIGPVDFEELGGFTRDQSLFWVFWALVAVVAWMASSVARIRPGRAMVAVRENHRAAEAIGVDVREYKIKVFTLASALGALCGTLYATLQQYVTPVDFDVFAAILFAAMIIIGGIDRIAGAIIGAIIVWGGTQWVSEQADSPALSGFLKSTDTDPGVITVGSFNTLVFGLLIVLVLAFEPKGLMGIWDRLTGAVGRRRGDPSRLEDADRRTSDEQSHIQEEELQ